MKILSVISQKGGVGKTTVATSLAVEAVRDGKSVLLIDLDPQASASFWADAREAEEPTVSAVPPARLRHVLDAAREASAELVVIDTPPFAKDVAFEAAERADFVLIPARPAVLDIVAMTRTVELLKAFTKRAAVVLTMCPPAGREIDEAAAAVDQMGVDRAPVQIGHRIAFSRAQQTGQSAAEVDPEGKAAAEIRELYSYTLKHL